MDHHSLNPFEKVMMAPIPCPPSIFAQDMLYPQTFDISMEDHQPSSRQRRICGYFSPTCTHLRSFLCLPPVIRHRIYCEAGLVNHGNIDLNRWDSSLDSWPKTADFKFSRNLLLTCRTIYAEASVTLYSTNSFFIRYRDPGNLRALSNLTPKSLSCLTCLRVHLNVASCDARNACSDGYPIQRSNHYRHDKPLGTFSHQEQTTLCKWQGLARRIATHIKPFKLRLYLICDAKDHETAEEVVRPLLSFPTLADCAIRLGRRPDIRNQDLAQKTPTRAMGHRLDHIESPFRFLDLPQELRRQILEYTDLITPLREVEWNPQEGFYLRYSVTRCDSLECPPEMHHACLCRNCWHYSNAGCFCRRFHAAFSSQCHCWSPPKSLFLVCRSLLEDARAVFFLRNRFVITPSAGCNKPAENTPNRLGVSSFLLDIVPSDALRFLRFLEVGFPPFDPDYLRPHEPAYQEWLRSIDHVKERLCLPLLTVRVYMSENLPYGGGVASFAASLTKEECTAIINMYARILQPLSKLKGLRKFYAHLAWPGCWTRHGRRHCIQNPEIVERQTRMIEQKCEWLVMGTVYDSMSLGKGEQRNSQWLEVSLA